MSARREGQNTGVRAKVVRYVENQPCGTALHDLTNDAAGMTYCQGCGLSWAELDGALNQRAGWLG